jgi:hypothetical protein
MIKYKLHKYADGLLVNLLWDKKTPTQFLMDLIHKYGVECQYIWLQYIVEDRRKSSIDRPEMIDYMFAKLDKLKLFEILCYCDIDPDKLRSIAHKYNVGELPQKYPFNRLIG